MKRLLLLVSLMLGSCSRDDASSGAGGNGKVLSTEETREVAMHILLNRYPKAEITSESSDGQNWRYRFSTNGVTVPSTVVVDRKAGKAHFEKAGQ